MSHDVSLSEKKKKHECAIGKCGVISFFHSKDDSTEDSESLVKNEKKNL